MQTKKIVLDISGCRYYDQLHDTIKQAFGFPEHYGKNLDALWDCLWETFVKKQPWEISICGAEKMNAELREYMMQVLDVFRQAEKEFPHVNVFLTSKE